MKLYALPSSAASEGKELLLFKATADVDFSGDAGSECKSLFCSLKPAKSENTK